MGNWLKVEQTESGVGVQTRVPPEEATHVPVEEYRRLEEELARERERNARLYEKLRRQIQNKVNWRRRAQAAAGGKGKKEQDKWEIRRHGGLYFGLRVVELDAEDEGVALAEALEWLHEYQKNTRKAALFGRVFRNGPVWQAEVWVQVDPDYKGLREGRVAPDQDLLDGGDEAFGLTGAG